MSKKKQKKIKISKNQIIALLAIAAALVAGIYLYNKQAEAAITPDSIITSATAQSGKPYVWGAVGPSGFDCSGLMFYVFQKQGGVRLANQRATADTYYHSGKKVAANDLRKGDLVFFEKYSDGTVHHIGVYAGDNTFIHASGSYGRVLKSKFTDNVKGKNETYGDIYAGARRVLKVKGTVPTYQPIRKGEKGTAVKSLQRDLIALGYKDVKVTGTYDTKTTKAVKKFQTDNKLKERNKGFFGPESWECMSQKLKTKYDRRYGA